MLIFKNKFFYKSPTTAPKFVHSPKVIKKSIVVEHLQIMEKSNLARIF